MTAAVHDALTIFVRQALPGWRAPWSLVFGMIQPLVLLALFGPLLGGVDGVGDLPGESSWQWFVPGVLIMLALFGTTATGYGLLTEMQTGSHERLLVTPISRSAMLVGRTLNDVLTLLAQAVLIVAVMLPFGFRLHLPGALVGLVLLAVLGVGVGALSHALAIACRKHQETFWAVHQTLLFPLLFLSGLMLPLDVGPGWMQAVGRVNPLTYVVDATRSLFDGEVLTAAVAQGTAVALGIAVIGLAVGGRSMTKSTS